MPVRASGRKIIEKSTGKVVGHSKSVAKAKSAARIRNWAHAAKKHPGSKAAQSFHKSFGD